MKLGQEATELWGASRSVVLRPVLLHVCFPSIVSSTVSRILMKYNGQIELISQEKYFYSSHLSKHLCFVNLTCFRDYNRILVIDSFGSFPLADESYQAWNHTEGVHLNLLHLDQCFKTS